MSNGNPAIGMRKWEAFKMALKWFTYFDVFNVVMLLVAVRGKLLPAGGLEPLWNILLIQWFAGVGAITLAYMTGNAVKGFAQRTEGG